MATTRSCSRLGSRPKLLIAVAGAAIAVGCAPQQRAGQPVERYTVEWSRTRPEPPLPADYPPVAFVVRWNKADGPPFDPKGVADEQCLAWDGHAELVAEHNAGDEVTAEFVCKGVPKRYWQN